MRDEFTFAKAVAVGYLARVTVDLTTTTTL
jgi:hypothetical protein